MATNSALQASIGLTLALALAGCGGEGDRRLGAVSAAPELAGTTIAAVDTWTAVSGGSIAPVWVAQSEAADVVVAVGALPPGVCGRTHWDRYERPTDYGTDWHATVTIDLASSDFCRAQDPSVVVAHELGHWMSGRHHLSGAVGLMNCDGDGAAGITAADLDFVNGGGSETP